MTATIRPLSPPHKGLRNLFSQFSLLSGVIEPGHAELWSRWRAVGDDLFDLLNDHARNETDHVFGPLRERADDILGDFQEEHGRLTDQSQLIQREFEGLSQASSSGEYYGFYLDFTVFHAANLELMAHEDRVIEPLLMRLFSDDELQAQQLQIMSRMPFERLLLWFQYIVPARQPAENVQVLRAFCRTASAEAWGRVQAVLQGVLNERDFQELNSRI